MPSVEPVIIGNATLYCGDCLEVMPVLPPVDMVFTSPPYAEQRDYGDSPGFCWENARLFMDSLPAVGRTQTFVNCGLIHKGSPVEYWRSMFDGRLRWFAWYVWHQGFGLQGDWGGRLAPAFEFVFHFCDSPRQPNKTKPCVSRGRKISNTALTKKDGSSSKATGAGEPVSATRIPDSVVSINREMRRDYDHPARFPVAFPSEFVSAYSDIGEHVLDPFMGSGTTGVACMNLGRKFIGIEIEPKYFDIACERIDQAQRQQRLFA